MATGSTTPDWVRCMIAKPTTPTPTPVRAAAVAPRDSNIARFMGRKLWEPTALDIELRHGPGPRTQGETARPKPVRGVMETGPAAA
ncbi:hypothetical protein GCM10029992_24220 [Glycomyces albus]